MNISVELAQAIANYLATRPWGEVNILMVGLHEANQQQVSAPHPDNTSSPKADV